MSELDELISVAGRENNSKRGFLLVNRVQAKHVAVSGEKAFALFDRLSGKLSEKLSGDRTLIVGFAETATAIGARLAVKMNSYYIQTTREEVKDVSFLDFSEEHSHAVQQRLVREDIEKVLTQIKPENIVFVDDEITTGKTILNIVRLLRERYRELPCFFAASLINGMSAENKALYESEDIGLFMLYERGSGNYEELAQRIKDDGEYIPADTSKPSVSAEKLTLHGLPDARRLVRGREYELACRRIYEDIRTKTGFSGAETVLVLGTEEFMYPAVYVCAVLCSQGIDAVSHSTTRSPIRVSAAEDYVLHRRYSLPGLYDAQRQTFVYDLKRYDKVIIMTDSSDIPQESENALINALASAGNKNITLIKTEII